jgi:hypothetical protein
VVPCRLFPVPADTTTSERDIDARDLDTGVGRIASVAIVIGVLAAVLAAATMWLLVSDPVTVANAVENGEVSPLVLQLAQVIVDALSGLLKYL